mmetsp:Transcript_9525/g.10874  ORF Transcript_9525/g.10874 Transcript_9525/m.10874 type:complete len:91 (+) Transcript_9525:1635-1907(+)
MMTKCQKRVSYHHLIFYMAIEHLSLMMHRYLTIESENIEIYDDLRDIEKRFRCGINMKCSKHCHQFNDEQSMKKVMEGGGVVKFLHHLVI